jgi:hypothetical protein
MAIKQTYQRGSRAYRRGWTIEDRIADQIKNIPLTDCWEWQGAKNNIGYGMIRYGKKMRTVHRLNYELYHDTQVPDDICVYHSCSNYICCNPAHLLAGTRMNLREHTTQKQHKNSWNGNPIGNCTNCNRAMAYNMLQRWHNGNCKHPSINTLHSGNT